MAQSKAGQEVVRKALNNKSKQLHSGCSNCIAGMYCERDCLNEERILAHRQASKSLNHVRTLAHSCCKAAQDKEASIQAFTLPKPWPLLKDTHSHT